MLTFWAILINNGFEGKTAKTSYWATYETIWAPYYFNLWSHWLCSSFEILEEKYFNYF